MTIRGQGKIWLALAAAAQVAALSSTHYFFTDRVYDTITRPGDELSRSGMSADQAQAISHALVSLKLSISDFVTYSCLALIAINFVALTFLLNNRKHE